MSARHVSNVKRVWQRFKQRGLVRFVNFAAPYFAGRAARQPVPTLQQLSFYRMNIEVNKKVEYGQMVALFTKSDDGQLLSVIPLSCRKGTESLWEGALDVPEGTILHLHYGMFFMDVPTADGWLAEEIGELNVTLSSQQQDIMNKTVNCSVTKLDGELTVVACVHNAPKGVLMVDLGAGSVMPACDGAFVATFPWFSLLRWRFTVRDGNDAMTEDRFRENVVFSLPHQDVAWNSGHKSDKHVLFSVACNQDEVAPGSLAAFRRQLLAQRVQYLHYGVYIGRGLVCELTNEPSKGTWLPHKHAAIIQLSHWDEVVDSSTTVELPLGSDDQFSRGQLVLRALKRLVRSFHMTSQIGTVSTLLAGSCRIAG
eukprot:TRINITY_DN14448_c0_g1_i1.p1 TRINITY_DN14448_c0_g1~~TRINITY_DN14448_c0_g1_i1.p1  ORF type:complete len:368 (+),score=59.22 TRINITY_DN14448_c0_g1_i1:61-1164(+)